MLGDSWHSIRFLPITRHFPSPASLGWYSRSSSQAGLMRMARDVLPPSLARLTRQPALVEIRLIGLRANSLVW
jgi:hypothetical protein